ncbi:TetR/AcrR family transcriptional regulator [Haliea sp.]
MKAKVTAKPDTTKLKRSHNRFLPLLDAAAKLFSSKGYKETTMRDIGAEIVMQPGSVYYHFKSKQELLVAVYEEAVKRIKSRTKSAIASQDEPWQRLESAVVAHVEAILDQTDYARVLVSVLPNKAPELRFELAAMRDEYEQIFIDLIDELPLKKDVNRKLMRLMLMGAMNSTQTWFREGEEKPAAIGRELVRYLRYSIEA